MKKNGMLTDQEWIQNCPITEMKLLPLSEMPVGEFNNEKHLSKYTYTKFDDEWVIRMSIHTNNLPLTSF